MWIPWWLDWRGKTAAIVACGPSVNDCSLEILRGKAKIIAINESWRLCPWADVLYGSDGPWWRLRNGVPEFTGLKLSQDKNTCDLYDVKRVHLVRKEDSILTDTHGTIGDGGNSGFQALNIAVQFGAKRIILIGFDMRLDKGHHWHGPHPRGLNNPTDYNLPRWRRALNSAADDLAALGIEVLNASPVSALTAYSVVSLEDALC